jgi:hypothetical protein
MSQWEDEDDDTTKTQTSFEDAGDSLKNEQDKEKLDQMGDYDANPAVRYLLLSSLCVLQLADLLNENVCLFVVFMRTLCPTIYLTTNAV